MKMSWKEAMTQPLYGIYFMLIFFMILKEKLQNLNPGSWLVRLI